MYFRYLKYIIKHKHYVLVECWKLGIPMRGILHDWHKLLPSEFIPYARYFYGKWHSWNNLHGDIRNHVSTKDTQEYVDEQFDLAWLKHQHRGKHHWQYWLLKEDNGTLKALPMPDKYRKEMLADWIGAGKAINGKNDAKDWYYKNRHKMILHPATKYWIEQQLNSL